MRAHRLQLFTIALLGFVLLPAVLLAQDAGARGGQRGAAPAGGRGGRGGRAAAPSAPTPHWANGRVNLDAAPGQKGFWNVMQGNVFGKTGSALPTNLTLDEVPFQDWARALYQY